MPEIKTSMLQSNQSEHQSGRREKWGTCSRNGCYIRFLELCFTIFIYPIDSSVNDPFAILRSKCGPGFRTTCQSCIGPELKERPVSATYVMTEGYREPGSIECANHSVFRCLPEAELTVSEFSESAFHPGILCVIRFSVCATSRKRSGRFPAASSRRLDPRQLFDGEALNED